MNTTPQTTPSKPIAKIITQQNQPNRATKQTLKNLGEKGHD
jgi:hypothetical protein